MQALINWYRAALRIPSAQEDRVIEQPKLLIWTEGDVALDKPLTYGLKALKISLLIIAR